MSSNDAIVRLTAAVSALGDVDVSRWDDIALSSHLEDLSAALCALDTQLSRVADGVRARGFRITEPEAVVKPIAVAGPVGEPDAVTGAVGEPETEAVAEPVAA
jgi:hypothetical protein